jgi:hypothetical protein
MEAPLDTITVLRCARGLRLAKVIQSTKTVDYDSARTFDAWSVPAGSLDDLHKLISRLIDSPRFCIVRGALVDGQKAKNIRRLVHADPKTGDAPTLCEAPRRWVALDVEGVDTPSHIPAADLEACARYAVQRLPLAFRQVACVVQATAGHGRKPDIRLRLWFWLSRPTSGGELNRWMRGSPADPSVFRAAQIIYTAAPIFEGCEDHLPRRLLRLEGAPVVEVPSPAALAPPRPPPSKLMPLPDSAGASRYAWAALRNAKARVARAPINSRHPTCVQESRSLARFVEAGLLTSAQVTSAMGEALQDAGKTKEEGEAVALWGLAHASTRQLPEAVA